MNTDFINEISKLLIKFGLFYLNFIHEPLISGHLLSYGHNTVMQGHTLLFSFMPPRRPVFLLFLALIIFRGGEAAQTGFLDWICFQSGSLLLLLLLLEEENKH